MIKEINASEFAEVTKEGFSIVDVYGRNCGACVTLDKTLTQLDFDMPFLNIYKLLSDDNKEFCKEHKIMGVPTTFFMFNGEIVDTLNGSFGEDEFLEIAAKYMYEV